AGPASADPVRQGVAQAARCLPGGTGAQARRAGRAADTDADQPRHRRRRAATARTDVAAMSYILDALRRADAERERGGVPGLHTQAMPDLGDDERAVRTRGLRPWHWVVLGLAGGLVVALAWTWRGGETAPPPPPPLPPPPVAR